MIKNMIVDWLLKTGDEKWWLPYNGLMLVAGLEVLFHFVAVIVYNASPAHLIPWGSVLLIFVIMRLVQAKS